MRKIILAVSVLLFSALYARGLGGNVTGTIVDQGGQAWANGTYTFNFVPNGSPPFSLNGAPYNPVPITGPLDSFGNFATNVPANNLMTPVGSHWKMTVCPQASSPCFVSGNLTITGTGGSPQDISASVVPPAISVSSLPGALAYTDAEVTSAKVGSTYYNLTSGHLRVCNSVPSGQTCVAWADIGTGSTTPGGAVGDIQLNGGAGAFVNSTAVNANTSLLVDADGFGWQDIGASTGFFAISNNGVIQTSAGPNPGFGNGMVACAPGSTRCIADGINDTVLVNADQTASSTIELAARSDIDIHSSGGVLGVGKTGESSGAWNFLGATSGSAALGVNAVAGTPNRVNMPTNTCLNGQVWQSDGNNPQQMSCLTLGVAPGNTPAIASNYFTAYNSTTGVFTQAQPVAADLSDLGTFNWTNSGVVTLSRNGAASAPTMILTGTAFAGTGSTSMPLFYVNVAGSSPPAGLSTGGTYIGVNAQSGFAGNLLGLYTNSVLELTVSGTGTLTANAGVNSAGASGVCNNARNCMRSPLDGRVAFNNNTNAPLGLVRFTLGTEAATNPAFAPLNTILDIVDGAGTATLGNTTLVSANGNKVFVTGNFTTAANTNLQTITGLTFNFPAVAHNWEYTCDLTYSQATANAAVAFGIQAATNTPTNIYSTGIQQITVGPPATVVTGTLATLATTTATNIVSGTPTALATNYTVHLGGMLELGATANAVNIMVSTATAGDAVTVLRGSSCRAF